MHGDIVMLQVLMVLFSDPLVPPTAVAPPAPEVRLRVRVTACVPGGFQHIERPVDRPRGLSSNLMFTADDEVRRYLLIERTVRGCSAPISYVVPYGTGDVRQAPATANPGETSPDR
jgi:hypothetical protein